MGPECPDAENPALKVIVSGKGGVGKTTIAGSLARQLARRGHVVVALDCDPSPNLGIPLGLSHDEFLSIRPVFNELVDSGHTHNDAKPDPEELLRRLHSSTPDGVMLLATGEVVRRADACMCCGSHASTRDLLKELHAEDRMLIADLEAGLNDLIWANPKPDDMLLAVAEPTVKSRDIAMRACQMSKSLGVTRILGIANRCTRPGDAEAAEAEMGVPVFSIPEDPALARADAAGVAALDMDPSSPAMVAIGLLAERVIETAAVAVPAG
jgi:CO dehydrogenase maturation factor